MSEIVPPHFHKDYRIEEKDLIADGSTVAVIPDFDAPEGTEVSFYDNPTFRRYKRIDGQWRVIGSQGMSLIQYIENAGTTLDINSLDINADEAYQLIVEFDSGSFQDEPRLRFSNDSTTNNYYATYEYESGSGLSGAAANNYLPLTNAGCNAAQINLLITKPTALNFLCTGSVTVQIGKQPNISTGTFRLHPVQLSGAYFGSNITSINLYVPSSQAMNWKAWLYKLETS